MSLSHWDIRTCLRQNTVRFHTEICVRLSETYNLTVLWFQSSVCFVCIIWFEQDCTNIWTSCAYATSFSCCSSGLMGDSPCVCLLSGSGRGRGGLYSQSPDCQEDSVMVHGPTESLCEQTSVKHLAKPKVTGADKRDTSILFRFWTWSLFIFVLELSVFSMQLFLFFFFFSLRIHYFQLHLCSLEVLALRRERCWHLTLFSSHTLKTHLRRLTLTHAVHSHSSSKFSHLCPSACWVFFPLCTNIFVLFFSTLPSFTLLLFFCIWNKKKIMCYWLHLCVACSVRFSSNV